MALLKLTIAATSLLLVISSMEAPVEACGIRRETIRRHMRRVGFKVRHCYEMALVGRRPFSTRIVFEFEILPSGEVASATARRNAHGALASCVLAVLKSTRFDKRADRAKVLYPFVFRPAPRKRAKTLLLFYPRR